MQGVMGLPWGRDSTVIPRVGAEDVAHVATALLTGPAVPTDRAYPLIGTVLTLRDIIATFSRVLGRDIQYEEISDSEWRRDVVGRGCDAHAVMIRKSVSTYVAGPFDGLRLRHYQAQQKDRQMKTVLVTTFVARPSY
jgi:uncharacterized protein YbjT (DUF2867 family)